MVSHRVTLLSLGWGRGGSLCSPLLFGQVRETPASREEPHSFRQLPEHLNNPWCPARLSGWLCGGWSVFGSSHSDELLTGAVHAQALDLDCNGVWGDPV